MLFGCPILLNICRLIVKEKDGQNRRYKYKKNNKFIVLRLINRICGEMETIKRLFRLSQSKFTS
jgi:hypothetical protein